MEILSTLKVRYSLALFLSKISRKIKEHRVYSKVQSFHFQRNTFQEKIQILLSIFRLVCSEWIGNSKTFVKQNIIDLFCRRREFYMRFIDFTFSRKCAIFLLAKIIYMKNIIYVYGSYYIFQLIYPTPNIILPVVFKNYFNIQGFTKVFGTL